MNKISFVLLLLIFFDSVKAQDIHIGDYYVQRKEMVLIQNFQSIMVKDWFNLKPDAGIPYLYIGLVQNGNEQIGQLLYQKDEEGNIRYWALSDNLKLKIKAHAGRQHQFEYCINTVMSDPFEQDKPRACIDCLLGRLNAE